MIMEIMDDGSMDKSLLFIFDIILTLSLIQFCMIEKLAPQLKTQSIGQFKLHPDLNICIR